MKLNSLTAVLLSVAMTLAGCAESGENSEIAVFEDDVEQSQSVPSDNELKSSLTTETAVQTNAKIKCIYIASTYEEHADFLLERKWCGHKNSESSLQIDAEVMEIFDFDTELPHWVKHPKNLKCIYASFTNNERGGFAYLRPDGRARFAPFPYDNRC